MKDTIQNLVNAAREAETMFRNFASEDPDACLTAGSPHAEACEMADKLNESVTAVLADGALVNIVEQVQMLLRDFGVDCAYEFPGYVGVDLQDGSSLAIGTENTVWGANYTLANGDDGQVYADFPELKADSKDFVRIADHLYRWLCIDWNANHTTAQFKTVDTKAQDRADARA